MDSATATPKLKKKELHSSELPIGQRDPITLPPLDQAFEHDNNIEVIDPAVLHKEYTEALEFMDEPIVIRIEPSAEKFAPRVVDCWVNGKGAEIFDTRLNKWIAYGAFPVGFPVVTRRKYVEALARAKFETFSTEVINPTPQNPDPTNNVSSVTSSRAVFSILEDRNPKGREWLTRIQASRA